jgi:hypothetical protein
VTHITVNCKKVVGSNDVGLILLYTYRLLWLTACLTFVVFMVVTVRIGITLWNVTLCSLVDRQQLQLQDSSSLKTEAAHPSVIFIHSYQTAQHCIPQECNLQPLIMPRKSFLMSATTANLYNSGTSQNSKDLSYTLAEAWNLVRWNVFGTSTSGAGQANQVASLWCGLIWY